MEKPIKLPISEEDVENWAYEKFKPGYKMVVASGIIQFLEEHNIILTE